MTARTHHKHDGEVCRLANRHKQQRFAPLSVAAVTEGPGALMAVSGRLSALSLSLGLIGPAPILWGPAVLEGLLQISKSLLRGFRCGLVGINL